MLLLTVRDKAQQFRLGIWRAGEYGATRVEQICSLKNPLRKQFVWSQKSEAVASQRGSQLKSKQRALLLESKETPRT